MFWLRNWIYVFKDVYGVQNSADNFLLPSSLEKYSPQMVYDSPINQFNYHSFYTLNYVLDGHN